MEGTWDSVKVPRLHLSSECRSREPAAALRAGNKEGKGSLSSSSGSGIGLDFLAWVFPLLSLGPYLASSLVLGSAFWTFRRPTCPGRLEEPTCQTCTLEPQGPVTLQSPLGVLGSPLPPSSLFLHLECTHLLAETHPLECLHTHHTQGPLCQASPCHLLDSSPQGFTLGSHQ